VALVVASEYPEQSVLAPRPAPRVGAQPILGAVVHAPAQNFDRVSAFYLTSRVTIHTFEKKKQQVTTKNQNKK